MRVARAGLAAALKAEDAYEVAVAQDELDDAVRIARSNGIEIDIEADAPAEAEKE
ncbi:hypothetical protein AB0I00_12840 [Streptomyces sp. NPDC050803]|uniref:hypothetical protein n=1 Tax=unclassified Streptomyces TaxID=2593676 RepID=UPI00341A6605